MRFVPLFSVVFFTTILAVLVLTIPIHANESVVRIVDAWVENGYLFHVAFEGQPANANCELAGEGLIEFEVAYDAQHSSGFNSVFGVALWYPDSKSSSVMETAGKAVGPQAFCTEFSPCHIQEVNIVKTWCPVTDGPLFSE